MFDSNGAFYTTTLFDKLPWYLPRWVGTYQVSRQPACGTCLLPGFKLGLD